MPPLVLESLQVLDSELRASSDKRYGLGAHCSRLYIQVGRAACAGRVLGLRGMWHVHGMSVLRMWGV